MDPRDQNNGKLHPTKSVPGPPIETSTFKEPLQVRSFSRSGTPQHRSAVYESLYGSPSRSPARSIPSPMRGLQSPSHPFESPSRDFLRSPHGYGDIGDQSRSPAPYRTPTMSDLPDKFSVNVYKLPPMVSPLHATPRRASESTRGNGNSSVEDPVLSELEAIPQPVYSGSYYPNFKKMAIKSYQYDSDDELSAIDNEDSEDEETRTILRNRRLQGISEVSSFQLPSRAEKEIGVPGLESLKTETYTSDNSHERPSHRKPTRLPTTAQGKRIIPKKNFLSTLSNLCFFQTGVKITFDQPSDEDPTAVHSIEQSDENTVGTINSIESEENFFDSEVLSEETVEDTLVFYVTKGKMAVELAPQDHLIDVTDDDNSLFKVQFSACSDGIEISEFKESLQLPVFTKVVKKGRPSRADIFARDGIQSQHVQESLENNRQIMFSDSPLGNFQEIVTFVELLVTLREQNRWQRLDLTLPQIGMKNSCGVMVKTTTPIHNSENLNEVSSKRDASVTNQTKDSNIIDIGSPVLPISIKEEIVSLPSHFSNSGSVQMTDVLPGPKSVIEIPKHLEKLVTSKGSFFIQIKFRTSMLGPIILSSKTEILALKELVIMFIKVYKLKESGGRKLELNNLRCQLSIFISRIRDILQPNIIDYLKESCTKKGLDAHSMRKKRQYPLRNGTLQIDDSGNITNLKEIPVQIKIEQEEEASETNTIAILSDDVFEEPLSRNPNPGAFMDKFYQGPILVKKDDKSEHLRNFAATLLPTETRSLTLDEPVPPTFKKRKNKDPFRIQKVQKNKKSPKKARLCPRPGLRSFKASIKTEEINDLNEILCSSN